MIDDVIAKWHAFVRGELVDGLETLLAEDVVFYSPIVFTPQAGKVITTMYLQAAVSVLAGRSSGSEAVAPTTFRYTKDVRSGDIAVLEFETTIDGKLVNGVDIITCNAADQIVEFRVMLRPLQAVNLVHQRMGELLQQQR